MIVYQPRGRKRVVREFTIRQGLLMLAGVVLVLILIVWLAMSGYVGDIH
jgi:hypothetical protein